MLGNLRKYGLDWAERLIRTCLVVTGFWTTVVVAGEGDQAPFADVHLHYKWSQAELVSPEQAVEVLKRNHIELAVVIGTPARLALDLAEVGGARIVPVYGPYESRADWYRWYRDDSLAERVRGALASGDYHGIGELHLVGGFAPRWDAPVIRDLADLGARFRVPLLIHTEFSRADYFLEMCGAYPETKMLWAHAGGILPAEQVRRVLEACDNVWVELSARDPWRFVRHPIAGDDGELLPKWHDLLLDYPDRFMVGSDPVWPVEQLDGWEEPDRGWLELERFIGFHRAWLRKLPAEVARRVRFDNAQALFRRVQAGD
jgi:hypothetical protein